MHQFNDIWVVDLGENFYFSIDIFHFLLIKELVFLIDFKHDFLAGVFVGCEFNESVRAY